VLLSLVIVVVLLDPTRPLRFFPRLISFCFHAKFHPLFFMFEISLCLPRLARSTYLLLSPHRTYRRRYYYYYYIIYSYLLLVGYQTISLSNSLLSYSSHPPSSPLSLSLFFISYYLRTYYLHVLFLLRSTLLCSLFISWRKDGFMIYSCFSFRTEEEDARRCS
jgi:uncharacterized membrane protein